MRYLELEIVTDIWITDSDLLLLPSVYPYFPYIRNQTYEIFRCFDN